MVKKKIAILGGGMAAMTAAYELTKTQSLRDTHEVTLYQMGWRLGGKGATGRDEKDRILEHGLHVWFGCYDNAFSLLKSVYDGWKPPIDCPLRTWNEAFKPHSFTPIGYEDDGELHYWPFEWPRNNAEPGSGSVNLSLTEMLSQVLNFIRLAVHDAPLPETALSTAIADPPDKILETIKRAGHWLPSRLASSDEMLNEACFMGDILSKQTVLDEFEEVDTVLWFLEQAQNTMTTVISRQGEIEVKARAGFLRDLVEIGKVFTKGLLFDVIIPRRDPDVLDGIEYRDWLLSHGADRAVVANSTVVRVIYDTFFWYEEGDPNRQNVGTGTAIKVLLRAVTTYKQAVLFEMQAGMGEVVFSPMYELLKDRGVKFKFFHKTHRLELSSNRKTVAKIHMHRQADLVNADYEPTRIFKGIVCWPHEPFWEQLVNGAQMRDAGVNFESHWNQWPASGAVSLELGVDYDDVVLGISMGGFMPLNAEPTMCDELYLASSRFREMATTLKLVPSIALQVWSDKTLRELGWRDKKPACVAGALPLDIWADMTHTLKYENTSIPEWQPKTVHYFCGVLDTQLFRQPATDGSVPHQAAALVADAAQKWLSHHASTIWPDTIKPDGTFDWMVLSDDLRRTGPMRLNAQFVRANIDPTECCVGSTAGSVNAKLRTDDTGFDNLYLAGCSVRTGLNTTCIEAAVMSGMQASRAICGEPKHVMGENFLT